MEEDTPSFSSVVTATNRNVTRLSRSVAVAASAVLSGDQASIANPGAYHRAMSDVVSYRKRLVASKIKENTPTQALFSSVARISPLRAPQIAAELLEDVPPPRAQFSLFQNYAVTVPSGSTTSLEPELALSVRKEMAASELMEIDERIAELKAMRKFAFERMANAEADQASSSEPTLQHFYPPGERIKQFAQSPRANKATAREVSDSPSPSSFSSTSSYTLPSDASAEEMGVSAIDFNSPFGSLAVAIAGSVEVRGLTNDECRMLPGTNGDRVNALVVQGAEPTVAAGAGSRILVWHAEQDSTALTGHLDEIISLDHDGDTLVSSSTDKTVRVWDERAAKCVETLDFFEFGTVCSLQHMGSALATGTTDGIVRLWDLRTPSRRGPQRELVGGHTGAVTALRFSGLQMASGGADGSMRIWDLRSGAISSAQAFPAGINSLGFDTAKIVASVNGESGVRVISRSTGEHRTSATGSSVVTAARYMKGYLVTGRSSGEVDVWAA